LVMTGSLPRSLPRLREHGFDLPAAMHEAHLSKGKQHDSSVQSY